MLKKAIQRLTEGGSISARDLFCQFTRSASFNLQLGVREIRMLKSRPWDYNVHSQDVDLKTMLNLVNKGLVEPLPAPNEDKGFRLTEAGSLVRQMLVYSKHIEPADVWSKPRDILKMIHHALGWVKQPDLVMQVPEMRTVDGEQVLVVRLNEGLGCYSEWAIPASAVKRIG